MKKISKSVGKGGKNASEDVKMIQELLNGFAQMGGYAKLKVDGVSGKKTIAAINAFQIKVMGGKADGRVDPGKNTIKALNVKPAAVKKEADVKKKEEATEKKAGGDKKPAANAKNLSGKAWFSANQSKYPNSNAISDLDGSFKSKVTDFQKALKAAGVSIKVSSTLRNEKRAAIMHWAFKVAKGKTKPKDVPKIAGVDINFDHGDDKVSIAKAKEMVGPNGFNIKYQPSLTSLHISGKAIDWTLGWSGDLTIKNKKGEDVVIKSSPKDGTNTELHVVGKTYGVIKLVKDKPHWSINGK